MKQISEDLSALMAALAPRVLDDPEYQAAKEAWRTEQLALRVQSALAESNVPALVRSVLRSEWRETATHKLVRQAVARAINEHRHTVIAHGLPGTGKTVALCRIALDLVASERTTATKCRFLSALELGGAIDWDDAKELLRSGYTAGVLVLDDLGQESRHSDRVVQVITRRHNDAALTLISTNLTPAQIGEKYDARILQRVLERGVAVGCTQVVRPGVAQ